MRRLVLIFIVLIASFHLGNCRMIQKEDVEEAQARMLSRKFLVSYKSHLSTRSYRFKEYQSNYNSPVSQSELKVPEGPNPLHN